MGTNYTKTKPEGEIVRLSDGLSREGEFIDRLADRSAHNWEEQQERVGTNYTKTKQESEFGGLNDGLTRVRELIDGVADYFKYQYWTGALLPTVAETVFFGPGLFKLVS